MLLHGLTGHARTWDRLARELSGRFRVLALDQRGHGDTAAAPDADYRVETMAGDFAGVDQLGLASFVLVGLAMGGRVAMAYAGAHPGRVARLVIVDIGPDIHLPGLERIRGMMSGAPERIESAEAAIEYVRRANPRSDEAELGAIDGPELGQPHRQVAVRARRRLVDADVERAVHGPEAKLRPFRRDIW